MYRELLQGVEGPADGTGAKATFTTIPDAVTLLLPQATATSSEQRDRLGRWSEHDAANSKCPL